MQFPYKWLLPAITSFPSHNYLFPPAKQPTRGFFGFSSLEPIAHAVETARFWSRSCSPKRNFSGGWDRGIVDQWNLLFFSGGKDRASQNTWCFRIFLCFFFRVDSQLTCRYNPKELRAETIERKHPERKVVSFFGPGPTIHHLDHLDHLD